MTSLCSIGCRTAVYLLAIAVATAALATPAAPSLTLDEAIRVALAGHPALRAAAQEVDGARAAVQGAKALPSPELVVTPAGTVDDSQLSLFQSLEVNGQSSARVAAARARVSSAEAQWEAARQEIVYGVRTAFYEALAAQQERDVAAQAVELLQKLHEAAQESFEAGDVPQSHVIRTRVELARAGQELRLAEGEAAARRAALNAAMGRDPTTPFTLQGEWPRPETLPDAETARATAERQRPELAAMQAETQAREAETRLARAARRPDVVLEAKRARLTRDGGSIGVGVTLPFVDWGRRRAEVRQAEAAYQAQQARLEQQRNQVALEVEEALARLQAAAEVARSYENGVLADAGRLAEMTQTGYQEGALTYLEVIDAQRVLVEARRGAIRARSAYANARAALDRAVGNPIADR